MSVTAGPRRMGHGWCSTGSRWTDAAADQDRAEATPPEPTAAGTRCCRSTHGILTFSARSCRLPRDRTDRSRRNDRRACIANYPRRLLHTAVRRSRIGEWWPGRPRPRGGPALSGRRDHPEGGEERLRRDCVDARGHVVRPAERVAPAGDRYEDRCPARSADRPSRRRTSAATGLGVLVQVKLLPVSPAYSDQRTAGTGRTSAGSPGCSGSSCRRSPRRGRVVGDLAGRAQARSGRPWVVRTGYSSRRTFRSGPRPRRRCRGCSG